MTASVITVPAFGSAHDGVSHFFGTRHHAPAYQTGVPVPNSEVRDRAWTLSVKQVHGTDALIVDRPVTNADRFEGGWDALITNQPGVTVVVRTADCVPVLIYDRRLGRAVASVHAGWRGALAGIVSRTIELMASRFAIAPSDLRVSIGPSAGPCCYEVDDAVLEPLRRSRQDWPSLVRDDRAGKAQLDLKALVRRQTSEIGIPPDQITVVNVCTICHPALFYSYRREGRVNGTMLNGITLLARR